MRRSTRNLRKFYYAFPLGVADTLDEYGNIIGVSVGYSNPILQYGNISGGRGAGETELFGIGVDYNKVINPLPFDTPITYGCVLWVDKLPVIKQDGSTDTPWDYTVSAVSQTLNNTAIAVKSVNVSISNA